MNNPAELAALPAAIENAVTMRNGEPVTTIKGDTMKATKTTNRKHETEARPYCAGERCKKCPHAQTCRNYWGGNVSHWDTFTDAEITRAVELMIAPDDLTIRGAALALFAVFGYTPEDVREQLDSGEYFNAGAVFNGLGTDRAEIAYPAED